MDYSDLIAEKVRFSKIPESLKVRILSNLVCLLSQRKYLDKKGFDMLMEKIECLEKTKES